MFLFVLILGLLVATVLLWFSMRRHLGRIDVDGHGDVEREEPGEGDPAG